MTIEMKRRDSGHKNERWKLDLGEKAVLINPEGKAVLALAPLEALSRFRMPSFGSDSHDLRVQTGGNFLTFSVEESDLRQIEHFLNRMLTATREKRSPVSVVQAALIALGCLGAFVLWRSMGSGVPPAPALAQGEPALAADPSAQQRTPVPSPDVPASSGERAPVPPRTPVEPPPISGIPAALVQREEAMAVEGLRECALFTGRYPESLATSDGHLTGVIREMRANPTAPTRSTRLDPGPARTRDEKIVCICRLMSFYTFLRGSGKEPAYYGKVVQPGEADRVLLWWRQGANECRVVYGDLRTETVAGERMTRLEAALPR